MKLNPTTNLDARNDWERQADRARVWNDGSGELHVTATRHPLFQAMTDAWMSQSRFNAEWATIARGLTQ